MKSYSAMIVILFSIPCLGQAGQKKPERTLEDRIRMTMASVRDGKLESVKVFVKYNPEFWKFVDKDGSSPTHYAAGFGRQEILEFLLSHDPQGESLRLRNNEGLRPLGMARKYHRADSAAFLEKKYKALGILRDSLERESTTSSSESSSVSTSLREPQEDSARVLFIKTIKVIQGSIDEDVQLHQLQENVSLNPDIMLERDDVGRTLLNIAAQYGKPTLVKFLLEMHADPNIADKKRSTPLAKAIVNLSNPANAEKKSAYNKVIKELMKYGAQVFAQIYVMFKPMSLYRKNLSKIVKKEVVLPNSHLVSPLNADALHATIAYVSVPMNYELKEGLEYTDQAHALLQQVVDVVNESRLSKKMSSFEFKPRPTFKPLGSFLVLEYAVPFEDYKKRVGKLYRNILVQVPQGSVQTFPEIEYPHVSLAKALPAVSDAQLKEGVQGGYVPAFLTLSSPFEGEESEIEVAIRIPSVVAPGYKEFSSVVP